MSASCFAGGASLSFKNAKRWRAIQNEDENWADDGLTTLRQSSRVEAARHGPLPPRDHVPCAKLDYRSRGIEPVVRTALSCASIRGLVVIQAYRRLFLRVWETQVPQQIHQALPQAGRDRHRV